MYIIEQGKAYQIEGDVAYQIKFDCNGSMSIDKENEIEVENKTKYSYEEMYRKLNVEYMIEQFSEKKRRTRKIQKSYFPNRRIKEKSRRIN